MHYCLLPPIPHVIFELGTCQCRIGQTISYATLPTHTEAVKRRGTFTPGIGSRKDSARHSVHGTRATCGSRLSPRPMLRVHVPKRCSCRWPHGHSLPFHRTVVAAVTAALRLGNARRRGAGYLIKRGTEHGTKMMRRNRAWTGWRKMSDVGCSINDKGAGIHLRGCTQVFC